MPAKSTKSKSTRQSGNRTGSRSSGKGSRPPAARRKPARVSRRSSSSLLAGLLELVSLTYFGRVILVLFVAALLILLNILLSRNQTDLFFRLSGIEMILAAAIVWLSFLLRKD